MQYASSYPDGHRPQCCSLGMQSHSVVHPGFHLRRRKRIAQIVLQQPGEKAVMSTCTDMDQSQGTCAQSVHTFVSTHKLAADTMLLGWERGG